MAKIFKKTIVLSFAFILLLNISAFATQYTLSKFAPTVYNLRWDSRTARWDVSGQATKYRVKLYRDGSEVCTRYPMTNYYNFVTFMARGDNRYFFSVQPFNEATGWGDTMTSTETVVIHSPTVSDYSYPNQGVPPYINAPIIGTNAPTSVVPGAFAPGVTQPTPQMVTPAPASAKVEGNWELNNGYYRFKYSNGAYATNTWLLTDGKWYYFNLNGEMQIGLTTINGKTYFLNQDGSMATGTIIINGMTHYFDQASGEMVY